MVTVEEVFCIQNRQRIRAMLAQKEYHPISIAISAIIKRTQKVGGPTGGFQGRPIVSHLASGHQARLGASPPRCDQRGKSQGLRGLLQADL